MTLEATAVLVLSALSLILFFRRFFPIVERIWRARPDADFELRPLAKRIREFVWQVLCQAKVIRQRPLPGLAHAFVFWGFCAFAFVTLNHVVSAFGLRLVDFAHFPGAIYYWFAFGWAILVAISIASLAFRRFVIRPKWLEPLSYESGVIALLIFILMVTYLATIVVAERPVAGRVNWWMHTLALLAFLPLIPHTKHLHLAAQPGHRLSLAGRASAAFRRFGDEDFGLVTGKDVTRLTACRPTPAWNAAAAPNIARRATPARS